MTYEELKIQLDLNEPIDILKSIAFSYQKTDNILKSIAIAYQTQTKDNDWFIVCDEGDCHLFNKNGNEIDISKIKTLNENIIPYDIKKIIIPDSVKNIEKYAFYDCENLTSIFIPDSVKDIGNCAFYGCKNLKSISIPNSVEDIGYAAFFNCINLTNLAFKEKTIDQIKAMTYYPWGIKDESFIKCIN